MLIVSVAYFSANKFVSYILGIFLKGKINIHVFTKLFKYQKFKWKGDLIYENHLVHQAKKYFHFALSCRLLQNKMRSLWNWAYLQKPKYWINDALMWASNFLIVFNLLLKKKTESTYQHDHFIREKMYYISFSTISDKRSDFTFFFLKCILDLGFGTHLILLFRMTSPTARMIFDVAKKWKNQSEQLNLFVFQAY